MNIPGPKEVINALRMTGQDAFADEFDALMAKSAEQPHSKPAPLPASVGGVKTFGVVPDPVYGRDKFGPTGPDTEGTLYVPLLDYQALRDELGEAKGEYDRSANKVASLSAQVDTLAEWHIDALNQLANREALLREAINGKSRTQFDGDLMHRVHMVLAASADPRGAEWQMRAALSARAEPGAWVGNGPWQQLTAPGQVQVGDWLSFTVSGRFICAPVRLVIDAGTDREEVVYNRKKNHYFVTAMAVDGTSTHKGVQVAKPRA